MKIHAGIVKVFLVMLVVICQGSPSLVRAQGDTTTNLGLSVMRIGEVKSGAVDLRVSVNTPSQGFFSPGDRVVITVESPREIFLTVMHASDSGDITILYPEKDKGDNSIPAGEKQILFGDKANANLIAGKEVEKGGTVAYLSPRQFSVSLIRFFQGKQWMEIPGTADKDLKLLKEKLEIVSGDRGFNRVEIPVKGKSGKNCALTISRQGRAITQERSDR